MNNLQAKRTARNAQLAGAALLLGAAGLLALPREVWRIDAAGAAVIDRGGTRAEARRPNQPDATLLASILEAISPEMAREKPPEVAIEQPDDAQVEVAPPPPTATWRYIGGLFGGTVRKGIVVIGEDQRFVKAGDTVDKAFVVDVKPEYLTVDESGVRRYIPMANKEKRTGMAAIGAGGVPGMPLGLAAPNPGDAAAKAGLMAAQAKERQAYLDEKRRIATQLGMSGANLKGDTPADNARRTIGEKARASGRPLDRDEQAQIFKHSGADGDFEFMEPDDQLQPPSKTEGN